jgi:hypothetical protein
MNVSHSELDRPMVIAKAVQPLWLYPQPVTVQFCTRGMAIIWVI